MLFGFVLKEATIIEYKSEYTHRYNVDVRIKKKKTSGCEELGQEAVIIYYKTNYG